MHLLMNKYNIAKHEKILIITRCAKYYPWNWQKCKMIAQNVDEIVI
jgi:hypothetical protein